MNKKIEELHEENVHLSIKCNELESYHENYQFAKPTEAEYLKNVLYRYMAERETLGKEIVTIAKVIGTVAKFTNEQLDLVIKKEEARHQTWLGVNGSMGILRSTKLNIRRTGNIMTGEKPTSTLRLDSGKELVYASESAVKSNIVSNGFSQLTASHTQHSDLESGIYEGGLKVWEENHLKQDYFVGKKVFELGCGGALPTILALALGAEYAVVNDFNQFVLESFTSPNFKLNRIPSEKWSMVPGSWSSLLSDEKIQRKGFSVYFFDVIFSTETIYNEQNYVALHDAMDALLSASGSIFIAAKVYYFGLGTSIAAFESFVKNKVSSKSMSGGPHLQVYQEKC
uniref:GRIP domain-containing protein n=1 Tax=Ditylenchus dipsaci TaxID=166011 RepID=A0A915EE39_9BILA